jgi:excisionase family DNA binding protein
MSILKNLRERSEPLNVKELAKLLCVSEATIQRWVRGREVPALRIGDTIRFDPGLLAEWIEQRSIAGGEPDAGTGQVEDANA